MLDDLDRLRSTPDEEIWRTSLIPQLRREPLRLLPQRKRPRMCGAAGVRGFEIGAADVEA